MSEQSSSGLPITLPDPQASELDTTFLPATQTPAQLLALAISKDLDIEKLERLMELQERWEVKQAKSAFYEATTEFQSICPEIKKTKTVNYTTSKGKTEYKYAPLPEIIAQIKNPLKKCGLSFRWEQEDTENLIKITCIVTHISGHSESTYLSGVFDETGSKNLIQARGSTVTYLQRYTLIPALGLSSADTDDDGRGSSGPLYENLLQHIEAVRENFDSVYMIKEHIRLNEYDVAHEAWGELDNDTKILLWRAPTKGGIFTTEERTIMKSDEFAKANG